MLRVDVHERYTDGPADDDDAFAIEHGQIDLAAMVREEVLLALADERLCRDDCPGLCPQCGHDLAAGPCSCDGHRGRRALGGARPAARLTPRS